MTHNQRKVKTTEDKRREKLEQSKARALEYIALKDQFLEIKANSILTVEALKLTTRLLTMAADCYTYWNYRKKIIMHLEEEDSAGKSALHQSEFSWTEGMLPAHPKSYWIWFHRKWLSERATDFNWKRDLSLCDAMLDKDQRNFHCWNYRRNLAATFNVPLAEELAFTLKKVEQNFSNYSAWHQRSYILPKLYESDPSKFNSVLADELEMVQSAFYTSPGDQSAWFYHRWLIGMTKKYNADNFLEIVKIELQKVEELLTEEPDSKWAILTTIFLMKELGQTDSSVYNGRLEKLQQADPTHKQFYKEFQTTKI